MDLICMIYNQLNELNSKIKSNRVSGRIAVAIMGMPYKCPPAPFEASLLVDSMLRKEEYEILFKLTFLLLHQSHYQQQGQKLSKQILDLIDSEKITFS